MSVRFQIAVMVGLMINAIIFGIGAVTVLSVPALSAHAAYLLPAVVICAFVITPLIAWMIAPRLRLRYWREHQ